MKTDPTPPEEPNKGIAYYKNLNLGHDIELPISDSPVRFGVMRRSGQSSNCWRVWGDSKGNFYISARGHMKESKISLHESGRQHMAFTPESEHTLPNGGRFISQWSQPELRRRFQVGAELLPSLPELGPWCDSGNARCKRWRLAHKPNIRPICGKPSGHNSIFHHHKRRLNGAIQHHRRDA